MVHTSLEQNSAQASAFQNFHRYASDTSLIHKCVTALLKTLHLARLLTESVVSHFWPKKLFSFMLTCAVMIGFD